MGQPDLDQAIRILDTALEGSRLRPAWRVVRTAARRNRRVRRTLPRIFEAAQHVTLALERLDLLIPRLPPPLFQHAAQVRDHLVALRDAVRSRREDDETQPRLDLDEP